MRPEPGLRVRSRLQRRGLLSQFSSAPRTRSAASRRPSLWISAALKLSMFRTVMRLPRRQSNSCGRQGRAADEGKPAFRRVARRVSKRETGLRTARRISHVFVMDVPTSADLFITDAAVNIAPDLMAKRDIIQNAIDLYVGLGLGTPKVAIFSAVETVPQHSFDDRRGRTLQVADRGQITGGELDGPLPLTMPLVRRPRASRASNRRSQDRLRSWSCRTSRPAICWPRPSHSSSKADAAGIVLVRVSRSF